MTLSHILGAIAWLSSPALLLALACVLAGA